MRYTPAAAALLLLALGACAGPTPTTTEARPAAAPAAPVPSDPEVDRLGLDLGIAMITQQCEDPAVQRQAARTREAVLARASQIGAQDRQRGEDIWAEAEAVMASQSRRPGAPECQRALPALRDAEAAARRASSPELSRPVSHAPRAAHPAARHGHRTAPRRSPPRQR